MTIHNDCLYNAALNAYIQAQGPMPTPYPSTVGEVNPYDGIVASAVSVAAALDAAIANDATISGADGFMLAPILAGGIATNQNAKITAVSALVKAQFTGQSIDPLNTAGLAAWATQAGTVLYPEMVANYSLRTA